MKGLLYIKLKALGITVAGFLLLLALFSTFISNLPSNNDRDKTIEINQDQLNTLIEAGYYQGYLCGVQKLDADSGWVEHKEFLNTIRNKN